MIAKNFKTTILLCCIASSCTFAGVGESAVLTLIFPYGARSGGMGEVGTALADDESALFFNPAGLGVQNSRWKGGRLATFVSHYFLNFTSMICAITRIQATSSLHKIQTSVDLVPIVILSIWVKI
ncbi:MAG TPA: hypothetical protein VHO70_00160 [Chitinispirillaceae bacterium]|nr:hypothetical protein [Chitinispirillaceae bacterium]